MSKRKLPLESPNWWPISDVLEHRSQRTGSDKLAAQDLNQALKVDKLRSLVRRADGSRELLAASTWDDFQVALFPFSPEGFGVFSRKLGKRPPGQWFFVWLPDYKNIFGDLYENSPPPAPMQEVPEKRGRKASHPWPEIGLELAQRVVKKGKSAGNKSVNRLAVELWHWCQQQYGKAPADSDLREFITELLRALRIERK